MDPNKALANLTNWAIENADTDETAAQFLALDEWLSKGGFLPDRWKRNEASCNVPGCSPESFEHRDPKLAYNWAKDHEINHQLAYNFAQANRDELRQALHEINESLYAAQEALLDARTILNVKLPRR